MVTQDIVGGSRTILTLRNSGSEGSVLVISDISIQGEYLSLSADYSLNSGINYNAYGLSYIISSDQEDYITITIDFLPLVPGNFTGKLLITEGWSIGFVEIPIAMSFVPSENSYSMVMGMSKYSVSSVDGNSIGSINYIR